MTKRELVGRSTDVAGIIARRFGGKPAEAGSSKEEEPVEDEFPQNEFDITNNDESFFAEHLGLHQTREEEDFGNYISDIRESRMSAFIRPNLNESRASAYMRNDPNSSLNLSNSQDTFQFEERMSQFQRPTLYKSGLQFQGRKSSIGNKSFRASILRQVREDDEEESLHRSVVNDVGFEFEV